MNNYYKTYRPVRRDKRRAKEPLDTVNRPKRTKANIEFLFTIGNSLNK